MEFVLSHEQTHLKDTVQRYCREHYSFRDRQKNLRSNGGLDPSHWEAFATFGWLGVVLPENIGGHGGSIIDMAIILEEFGRSLVLEPYLFAAVLASQAIGIAAEPTQARELLDPLVRGVSILALAHQEPRNTQGVRGGLGTTARVRPDGDFILQGRKTLVLGGDQANRFLVSAQVSGQGKDTDGVSLFLVDRAAPGLSIRNYRMLDGRGAADLQLSGTPVPSDAELATNGTSLMALDRATDWAIVGLCAEALGSMDSVISTTIAYLKMRRAGGSPLSEYQALQHRIADMVAEREMARSILHAALAAFSSGAGDCIRQATSTAKAIVGAAGTFIAANGIQLHGAAGMVDDYIIGQQFKRLTVVEALFGNSDFHLSRRLQL